MIDTDKYGNKKRNWKVRDTFPDGASIDVELGWVYEDIVAVKGNGHYHYTVAQMVDTGGADAQLIADAPLILEAYKEKCEEVKRLRKLLLTHDVCPTCGYYADNDFSLDCCKTWGLGE